MRILLVCLMLLFGSIQAKADCIEVCQKAAINTLIKKSIEVGRGGDLDGSLKILESALELDEEHAEVISLMAAVHFVKEDYEKSIQLFDKALLAEKAKPVLFPNEYSGIYASKGIAYVKLEQYDKAIQNYTESLKLKPINVWTYKRRAEAYVETQQFLKALEDYNHIVKIDEESKKAIIDDIAYIYLKMGGYQKALDASKEASDLGVELNQDFYSELEGLKGNN